MATGAGILWRDYDRFMQKYVKTIGDGRLTKVPADLDLKPYRDEHDYDLVKRMLACIARGEGPPGVTAEDVRRAVERHMPQLKHVKPKEPQVGRKRLLVGRPSAPQRAGRSHAARRVRSPGPL
jgi:hypothetical protein